MTHTHDYAALVAAVDAGDDTALAALADLLEEMGDARAAGLRASQRMRSVSQADNWHDARAPQPPARTPWWVWRAEPSRGVVETWHLPRLRLPLRGIPRPRRGADAPAVTGPAL